jgi:hypothetical protein
VDDDAVVIGDVIVAVDIDVAVVVVAAAAAVVVCTNASSSPQHDEDGDNETTMICPLPPKFIARFSNNNGDDHVLLPQSS